MAELLLDIHLDFDVMSLAGDHDPTRTVYEASQRAAVEECSRRGATLRHSDPRQTVIKTAQDPLTGRDVLLIGTRWIADGPQG